MGKKKVVGDTGITAGGDISVRDVSGQVAIGKNIYQFDLSEEILGKLIEELRKPQRRDTTLTPVDELASIEKAGQTVGAKTEVIALIKFAYQMGKFVSQVLEEGENYQTYERFIGGVTVQITPAAKFENEFGLICREYTISKKHSQEAAKFFRAQSGQWYTSTEVNCRGRGGLWSV